MSLGPANATRCFWPVTLCRIFSCPPGQPFKIRYLIAIGAGSTVIADTLGGGPGWGRCGMSDPVDESVVRVEPDKPASLVDAKSTELTCPDFAKLCGVTTRALRFYESRGLISPRRQGRVRIYSQHDSQRVALILRAKKLGFTLAEIGRMIDTKDRATISPRLQLTAEKCLEQITCLEGQKSDIVQALAELRQIHLELCCKAAAEAQNCGAVLKDAAVTVEQLVQTSQWGPSGAQTTDWLNFGTCCRRADRAPQRFRDSAGTAPGGSAAGRRLKPGQHVAILLLHYRVIISRTGSRTPGATPSSVPEIFLQPAYPFMAASFSDHARALVARLR